MRRPVLIKRMSERVGLKMEECSSSTGTRVRERGYSQKMKVFRGSELKGGRSPLA